MAASAPRTSLSGLRARARGLRAARATRSGAAEEDSRLRAAEDLVAREAHEVGARVERLERNGLVGEAGLVEAAGRARARVVDEGHAPRARERGEVREGRPPP